MSSTSAGPVWWAVDVTTANGTKSIDVLASSPATAQLKALEREEDGTVVSDHF